MKKFEYKEYHISKLIKTTKSNKIKEFIYKTKNVVDNLYNRYIETQEKSSCYRYPNCILLEDWMYLILNTEHFIYNNDDLCLQYTLGLEIIVTQTFLNNDGFIIFRKR
jgi:hypothetical protein